MAPEQNKRSRRIPLSSEEVATIIAYKKHKEEQRLITLKKSTNYKVLNIFNTLCFFIFCEIVFCFYGPANYQTHYSYDVRATMGQEYKPNGTPIIAEVDVHCVHGQIYKFIINDYITVPQKYMAFDIGSDWLLGKELKASFENSDTEYRNFAASPILFLSIFTSSILLFGICFNLNENEHSLLGLTIINIMTLMCVVFI